MGQRTVKTWIGTGVAIALSGGLAVGCSRSLPDDAADTASEKTTSPENTLIAYARSVLDIEPLQKTAYENIKNANTEASQPPNVTCNDRNTVTALRGEVKKIAVDYCNQAKAIAEKHGLTPQQFNQITQQLENDPQLKEAIKNELLKLQQPSSPSS
jgi:Domain of unknown function (DUF4168)